MRKEKYYNVLKKNKNEIIKLIKNLENNFDGNIHQITYLNTLLRMVIIDMGNMLENKEV